MSIHSLCFNEGQSGRCGLLCRAFNEGDCDIEDEIFENTPDLELYYSGYGDDYLFNKYIGEFLMGVMMAQTKFEFDYDDYLLKRILSTKEDKQCLS